MMRKTGKLKNYDEEGSFKYSNNWEYFNLKKDSIYKGRESVIKWYNKYKEYDFKSYSAKNQKNSFYVNIGVSIIWKPFKKIGFWYYFKDDNHLYTCVIFDQYIYSPQNSLVFLDFN